MKRLITIATLTFLLAGCGAKFINTLNASFDAAPIAVTTLEEQGAISSELASQLRVDIPDGQKIANDLFYELKAIPKDAPDRRARQLAAWQTAETKWLAIVNRGHFKLTPKMQKFADIANGLFATAVRAYGGISAQRKEDGTPVEAPVPPNMSDEQIEQMLEKGLEKLRDSLK